MLGINAHEFITLIIPALLVGAGLIVLCDKYIKEEDE